MNVIINNVRYVPVAEDLPNTEGKTLRAKVLACFQSDSCWTVEELKASVGGSSTSISSTIRDLRKIGYNVAGISRPDEPFFYAYLGRDSE